jgi:hypothetical protein
MVWWWAVEVLKFPLEVLEVPLEVLKVTYSY